MSDASSPANALSEGIAERVLARLGLSRRPEPTLEGLGALYGGWCQAVPFDNVRKLIHARAGLDEPFPGGTAADFFAAWLKHGTGGTCWAGAGAFHALLSSLGFDAERGIGTMLVTPELPPNHGTVRVRFDDAYYLVDCSNLHGEPLPLHHGAETRVTHPAWGVRCAQRAGHWYVHWRPLQQVGGLDCRLESFGASQQEYLQRYEKTRTWSPFNYQVTARLNRGDRVTGLAFGQAVTLASDGTAQERPVTHEERLRVLIDEIGVSEEMASQLPEDTPTPPPPWSRAAKDGSAS